MFLETELKRLKALYGNKCGIQVSYEFDSIGQNRITAHIIAGIDLVRIGPYLKEETLLHVLNTEITKLELINKA